MAMIEPLIHTNYCALCSKPINGSNQYYCLSISLTSEHDKCIHMCQPKYGYFCVSCGDALNHLFTDGSETMSED